MSDRLVYTQTVPVIFEPPCTWFNRNCKLQAYTYFPNVIFFCEFTYVAGTTFTIPYT